MKTTVWLAWAAFFAGLAVGAEAVAAGEGRGGDEAASAAKAAYDKGDAAGALERWEAMAASGVEDSHLDYNMGNALYRLERFPEAIRMYRRAQRALPRDPDVEYNLGLAAQAAGVAVPGRTGLDKWLGGFSPSEWFWAAEAGFWALLGLCAAGLVRPDWRERLKGATGAAGVLLLAGALGVAWPRWLDRHPECVVTGESPRILRSAPLDTAAETAEAVPGTLVRRVAENGFWAEVETGGVRGWLPASALEEVAATK